MKKLLFTIAVFVVGYASGNVIESNDSIKKDVEKAQLKESPDKLCGVCVDFYDINGNYIGSHTFSSQQPNLASCASFQGAVLLTLKKMGLTITTL